MSVTNCVDHNHTFNWPISGLQNVFTPMFSFSQVRSEPWSQTGYITVLHKHIKPIKMKWSMFQELSPSEHIRSQMSLVYWLNSSVAVSSSGLFFCSRGGKKKWDRQREHAAGSGKHCSTGVSVTASYVTGATHTVLRLNQLYIPLHVNSHSLSPALICSSCFPRHIKHSPCPTKQPISSYSINSTSGGKHCMLITSRFSIPFLGIVHISADVIYTWVECVCMIP